MNRNAILMKSKKALKTVKVKYYKGKDEFYRVTKVGTNVTKEKLSKKEEKYYRNLKSSKDALKPKGCIVCGCDFTSGFFNHKNCNN